MAWEEAHVGVDAAKPGSLVNQGREAMELIEEAMASGLMMMMMMVMIIRREQCRGRGGHGS